MRVCHDATMIVRLHETMTHEHMRCVRISMRVYGHYTNAPPFGNDFPLGSWHHLKTALSSTLGNANPHILIKCFSKNVT